MSTPVDQAVLANITSNFALDADFVRGALHGNGLINDTFIIDCQTAAGSRRYILQRVNHHVLKTCRR